MPADFHIFGVKETPIDVRCWLKFQAETFDDSMCFLVPILGMNEAPCLDEDSPHPKQSDEISLIGRPNSFEERRTFSDEIIATLRNSYFRTSFRRSIPKRRFIFSEAVLSWLKISRSFEVQLTEFQSWGISIQCVFSERPFDCLLKQEGFEVQMLPIYPRNYFNEEN